MLQFSRQSQERPAKARLSELLDRSVELVSHEYDYITGYDFRRIEIERSYDAVLPPITCHRVEIEQVFLNIIKNAAHSMESTEAWGKKPRLRLRTYARDGQAVAEIEDNGAGMDERVLQKVFQPFFTTKPPGAGTGLGMAVAYAIIVENHKGEMEAASEPGTGTRITVRLPFQWEENA